MIRVSIYQGDTSFGSLFVGGDTVELNTADRDRFLAALGEAVNALSGRDCAKGLQGGKDQNDAKAI